ncbi:hypothetical protein Nmel_010920 [Mimus melanotis]
MRRETCPGAGGAGASFRSCSRGRFFCFPYRRLVSASAFFLKQFVLYVRGSDPVLKLLDDSGNIAEELSILKARLLPISGDYEYVSISQ